MTALTSSGSRHDKRLGHLQDQVGLLLVLALRLAGFQRLGPEFGALRAAHADMLDRLRRGRQQKVVVHDDKADRKKTTRPLRLGRKVQAARKGSSAKTV